MNRRYLCARIAPQYGRPGAEIWRQAQVGAIDCYPWAGTREVYCPRVEFRLIHDGQNLFVRFDVWESNIRATYTQPNDPVCRDSCVEFFFRPCVGDPRYLSFEINPLGTLLIGLSTSGQDLRYFDLDRSVFRIAAVRETDYWSVEYQIPFSFLREIFGEVEPLWQGNFMKCADRSVTPHHGCWNRIGTEIPMFHVPQFFGEIQLMETIGKI